MDSCIGKKKKTVLNFISNISMKPDLEHVREYVTVLVSFAGKVIGWKSKWSTAF